MRSSSVQSLVNIRSIAIITVLSLTLSVAVPAANAATRPRSKSSVTQPERAVAKVQRTIQRLINRFISITGDLPADPWPRIMPPASVGDVNEKGDLPADPLP